MREAVDRARIEQVMEALGAAADRPVRVYFAGGATAVLMGWRASTVDIDFVAVPDSGAMMRAIPALKSNWWRRHWQSSSGATLATDPMSRRW